MKTLNRNYFLQSLLQQVEAHLFRAVTTYQNLDEVLLTRPGENGGWSIAECLEHLNTYSRYYLPYLEKALSEGTKAKSATFSSSWLGRYFQSMMDPEKSAKKYKAARIHTPMITKRGDEVVAEFIDNQERLFKVLEGYVTIDLNATKIPTSISSLIRLNLGDTLAFLITHDERHIIQADKNLDSVQERVLSE